MVGQEDLTGEQILSIPENMPEKLFSNDLITARSEFTALSFRWFPDHCPDPLATIVFIHIKKLYDLARIRLQNQGSLDGRLSLTTSKGVFRRPFHIKHYFELGEYFIGDLAITYVIKPAFKDFYNNAIEVIQSIHYRDSSTRLMMCQLMPSIEASFEADEGLVLILRKTADTFLLSDILSHFGTVEAKHVAWIFERLMNICCFLQFGINVVHHSINTDTIFVNPKNHSVHLFGGWWYSTPESVSRAITMPEYTRTYGVIQTGLKPDYRQDLTTSRAVARELLGDAKGLSYRTKDSKLPKQMVEWLDKPTSGNALTDYRNWKHIRDLCFAPKTFHELSITVKDLYTSNIA